MAKKVKIKLLKRDWIIFGLFLLIILTNLVQYQIVKSNEFSTRADAEAWFMHQVQINKLKACIDENTRPCDITPPQVQL